MTHELFIAHGTYCTLIMNPFNYIYLGSLTFSPRPDAVASVLSMEALEDCLK